MSSRGATRRSRRHDPEVRRRRAAALCHVRRAAEKEIEWTDAGLEGSFRFLARVWRLVDQVSDEIAARTFRRSTVCRSTMRSGAAAEDARHYQAREPGLDPRVHLNTAVSAQMELVNELYAFCDADRGMPVPRHWRCAKGSIESLVLMLSPFAPHMCEELWKHLGHMDGIVAAGWPAFDEAVAKADEIVVPVQVNGKLRSRLTVRAESTDDARESWRSPIGGHGAVGREDGAKIVIGRWHLGGGWSVSS